MQLYSHQGKYAGFITRAVAFVIDLIIISGGILFGDGVLSLIEDFFQMEDTLLFNLMQFIGLQLIFPAAYFIGLVGLFDQTIGKALMGLRVIKANGDHMDLRRAAWRFALIVIGIGPFFMGYIWVLIDNRRRGWHDILAGTYVIYEEDRVTNKNIH